MTFKWRRASMQANPPKSALTIKLEKKMAPIDEVKDQI
jgi:hypothetical protein